MLSHKTDRRMRLLIKGDNTVFLPDELVTKVLSFSDVKFLMQMRCVWISWKSIISNPNFVKLYLKRFRDFSVVPFPVSRLRENSMISLPNDPHYGLRIKTVNMLLVIAIDCFVCLVILPSMERCGSVCGILQSVKCPKSWTIFRMTYKVVMLLLDEAENRTRARVLNLRDNVWKPIQIFPAVLLYFSDSDPGVNDGGVYFNGSLNWLDHPIEFGYINFYAWKKMNGTKTYTKLMPPCGFYDMSLIKPLMEEFGVEESWTQLIKIRYQNLQSIHRDFVDLKLSKWLPFHLSDHGDTLILAKMLNDPDLPMLFEKGERQVII
ncbi:hypothetical protein MTR_4g053470 [Medicago truncatula]|uniref:F-box domain-containing protein n=1 Tax=Medicago truncatula TaxID=3880 RepID=G7JIG1_MEDTR|nr:hypothetical protein MTR_4g053470 [Medicago truncatula]